MNRTDPVLYRYYNAGSCLGVIGTIPTHQDGAYTYLPSHCDIEDGPWIRTEDLHSTRDSAEKAAHARFHKTEHRHAND